MPEMNRNELDRVIRAGEAGGAYYIYGTDSYTIGQMKNVLIEAQISGTVKDLAEAEVFLRHYAAALNN